MNRRSFLGNIGIGAMGLAFGGSSAFGRIKAKKPNVLYIMSDDHAANAIGVYGSRLAKLNPTPVIDKLAKEGMRLDNCFCTNSICSPSRATILTGQFSHVNGVTSLGGKVEADKQYLPILMGQAGYQTAMIGKWHLGIEPMAFEYYKVLPGQGKYFDPDFKERVTPGAKEEAVKDKGHSSDVITDSSLKWLKGRDKSRPFFLMHHFKSPHGQWENAPRYDSYLEDVEIPEPESLYEQGDFGSIATLGAKGELKHLVGSSVGLRNEHRNMAYQIKIMKEEGAEELSEKEIKHLAYQRYLKRYLRCVKGNDDNIKRLVDYLAAEGELDNTIIIYSSDQGMMLGEHDYIDKRWMYEESLRMPFVVRYPKAIKAGSVSDAIVNNVDFGPLMLDYAGVERPGYMQGRSFREILETGKEPSDWPQLSYYRYWLHMAHHYNPAHFGIRTKEYKLIFFYGQPEKEGKMHATPPGWELYDMKKDPEELNNLYGKKEYVKVADKLKKQLLAERKRIGDLDKENPHILNVIAKHWEGGEEASRELSGKLAEAPEIFEKNEFSGKKRKKSEKDSK
ncbi:MAG: sulfatase [Phycisphaerae bacterium]|nr:sulfatase [Phycisphaerae bacterium]